MRKENHKKDIEYIVKEESLLLEFLLENIQGKSKNNIKTMLSRKDILVDNKSVTQFDYKLKPNQKIAINLTKKIEQDSKYPLDIMYEDNDLIVINKREGLLSISTEKEKEETAYHYVMKYLKKKEPSSRIFVIHRLDSETSGILMFAKNERIKLAFQDNWNELVTIRGYYAVVEGNVKEPTGTIKSWLKETKTLLVYSSSKVGDGLEAITHYTTLKSTNEYSLLDIKIDTGRRNQIRVHMKDIGHCVVGDKKYGAKENPIKRVALHSYLIEFQHPFTKQTIHFQLDMPKSFKKLVH